jgi:Fur family ferric uptake transcriptional regulator
MKMIFIFRLEAAMEHPSVYKTKQREAILAFLSSLEGEHVTAAEIAAHFRDAGSAVGLTTVYRHLEKLTQAGLVTKYMIDGVSATCYQAVRGQECREHFHLKCESCGALVHMQCDLLDQLAGHFREGHGFALNPGKTVFYGLCRNCEKSL